MQNLIFFTGVIGLMVLVLFSGKSPPKRMIPIVVDVRDR
jgi:hypothetical protein